MVSDVAALGWASGSKRLAWYSKKSLLSLTYRATLGASFRLPTPSLEYYYHYMYVSSSPPPRTHDVSFYSVASGASRPVSRLELQDRVCSTYYSLRQSASYSTFSCGPSP